MKVKHYHKEYDSYKTERQWALEGFLVAENVEGIELLPSKQSKQPCKYYKPDEIRPATESEVRSRFEGSGGLFGICDRTGIERKRGTEWEEGFLV